MPAILDRATIPEPPVQLIPPSPNFWDGDDDNLWKIVVFWDDEKSIEEVLITARMMAESIWRDTFSFYTSTEIVSITDYLTWTVIRNPKLLISLVYIVNQWNVDDCLTSFMNFLDKLPGFKSSTELGTFTQKIEWEISSSPFTSGTFQEWELEEIVLRHEPKSRATRKLICGHTWRINLEISRWVSHLLLDRYADIGRSTLDKFIWLDDLTLRRTFDISKILIKNMTDFTLFLGED
jgi:hypothetical protein